MTDTARTYKIPSLNDLTLNDAFAIKMHTGIDVLRPPTVAHNDAALLWWLTRNDDEPLVYEDLIALTLQELGKLIDQADDDDEDAEPETVEEQDDAPKASESSSSDSSPSPAIGDAPPPISEPAPSESSD